ncbi:hypothetical protein QCN29_11650 [Streptomyces sp. HNM0663]|uniref:Lipoprotein n=1 Tax=Streptomyces chengmaiensis TaxID=3040919 RepID=A0ABT6HL20_9ACTN|nr:hypothetical protein [Streptomyces chengmaiensis]MDH2389437.1 hypothetical protein [Streptomyces chengmaiensis]
MSATSHRYRHRALAAGAALLTLATAAGCSGLGRSAVGTFAFETARHRHIAVTNPSVKGCHRFPPAGAVSVENTTSVDVKLYTTRDCTGGSIYVPASLSDVAAPGAGPWRSFSFIH